MTATRSEHRSVQRESADLPLTPARRAGEWIAVSGQIGVRSGHLVPGGVGAETAQALENLCAVLKAAGASLESVQKVNVYLSSIAHYTDMNAAYSEAFAAHPLPARTAVAVLALPRGASVEIEAWAYVPSSTEGAK